MWKDISSPWKTAFEGAWEAFRCGSVPIGAALYDKNGELVIRERNRCGEAESVNRRIAHAEANALRRLDTEAGLELRSLVLYTTMEPCPMCMGMSVMSGIRHIRFAARDTYCGFTYLSDKDPYFAGKHLDIVHEGGELEFVQITMQSVFELERISHGASDKVLVEFRTMLPEAVEAAERLYNSGIIAKWSAENLPADEVFDKILKNYE